ncbi:DUF485 domain-containing protein [Propionibacteriaceae bacterium Y1923]|uniref:DUF485 domain-containing protein n=1 Tax=Aestuariimicrobium sp. Y1814 TaxID=3418742 RepID=UPI003C23AC47
MTSPQTQHPSLDPEDSRISDDAFIAMQNSDEFAQLRKKFRNFSFPLSVAFLVWYFGYVLLSTYAVDFMQTPVVGNVNLGILLGLLQFVTTFGITALYIRHANKNLDPIAGKLRAELEGGRS